MQKTTNGKSKPAKQMARKGQEYGLKQQTNGHKAINNSKRAGGTQGEVQELQQEVANLKACLEVTKKEIDALNALVRYLERRGSAGKA